VRSFRCNLETIAGGKGAVGLAPDQQLAAVFHDERGLHARMGVPGDDRIRLDINHNLDGRVFVAGEISPAQDGAGEPRRLRVGLDRRRDQSDRGADATGSETSSGEHDLLPRCRTKELCLWPQEG
jgi:hypothetical protein